MTDDVTPKEAPTLAEAAKLTFEQWRSAGACLSGMVAVRVKELTEADQGGKAGEADEVRLREIHALVLTARRVMELEDRYEQKVQSRTAGAAAGAAGAGTSDLRERFDALARAAGLRIVVADDDSAECAGGVSP